MSWHLKVHFERISELDLLLLYSHIILKQGILLPIIEESAPAEIPDGYIGILYLIQGPITIKQWYLKILPGVVGKNKFYLEERPLRVPTDDLKNHCNNQHS
jgi:hypothetical protein